MAYMRDSWLAPSEAIKWALGQKPYFGYELLPRLLPRFFRGLFASLLKLIRVSVGWCFQGNFPNAFALVP